MCVCVCERERERGGMCVSCVCMRCVLEGDILIRNAVDCVRTQDPEKDGKEGAYISMPCIWTFF